MASQITTLRVENFVPKQFARNRLWRFNEFVGIGLNLVLMFRDVCLERSTGRRPGSQRFPLPPLAQQDPAELVTEKLETAAPEAMRRIDWWGFFMLTFLNVALAPIP
jgi:hypothetical protein